MRKINDRGILTLNQNLDGFVSLLNTHGFSSLVKEARIPLSLLGPPYSTRPKSSIDLQLSAAPTLPPAQSLGAG